MKPTSYNVTEIIVDALKKSPLQNSCYKEANPGRALQFAEVYLDEYSDELRTVKESFGKGRKSKILYTDDEQTFRSIQQELAEMDWEWIESRAYPTKQKRRHKKSTSEDPDQIRANMVIYGKGEADEEDNTLPRVSFAVSNDVMDSLEFLANAKGLTVNKLVKRYAEQFAEKAQAIKEELSQL